MDKYYIHQYHDYDSSKIYNVGDVVPERYVINTAITYHKDYDNITNIENWKKTTLVDYVFRRNQMQICSSGVGFANLSAIEKELVCDFCAEDPTTLIGYIMVRDQISQTEAYIKYLTLRSIDIKNAATCYSERIYSPDFTKTIILYLGMDEGEVFLDACRNFISDLKDVALLGTQYNNNRDGIMDYIESTGSYVGGGLLDYTIQPGLTRESLIDELKKIIYYGRV